VVWIFVQGAGFDGVALATSVCNLGLIPGELTGRAPLGTATPLGEGLVCLIDREIINKYTPITSMFLHGSWAHLGGNALFLWIFGNNVEDSMGRLRFIVFYLLCGFAAAAAQVFIDPASPVPMVGASGAISGVLGGYLILYPRVRVNVLFIIFFFIQIISVPAYLILLWWIALQLLGGLPQLGAVGAKGGVAFWAHIGGFVAGAALIKLFENRKLFDERRQAQHRQRLRYHWP
jgi:membrane associated rhomboid family serine protease